MFGLSQKEKNAVLTRALLREEPESAVKALEKGADPDNSPMPGAANPMHWAAALYDKKKAQRFIKALLEAGADINSTDSRNYNVLAKALEYKNYETFAYLIEEGADTQQRIADDKTLLQMTLENQHWPAARYLVDLVLAGEGGTEAQTGSSLLINLIDRSAPYDIVMKALAKTQDVNVFYPDKRFNALTVAAQRGNDAVVDLLLTRPEIDVNASLQNGRTALHIALSTGRNDMATKLIDKGADLFKVDERGLDPLRYAAQKGFIPAVRAILKQAKELGKTLELDKTMLAAAYNGQAHVVGLLIEAGADPNAVDERGRTAAIKAAEEGHLNVLKMLNRHKADMLKGDNNGMPPLDHAIQFNKDEAKEYLKTLQPGYVPPAPPPPPVDTYRFTRVSDTTIDVKEKNGLTMTFNFWTQQLLYRESERGSAISVQNFADVPRREAILEAYEKLKQLGGRPPEPFAGEDFKKTALPKP